MTKDDFESYVSEIGGLHPRKFRWAVFEQKAREYGATAAVDIFKKVDTDHNNEVEPEEWMKYATEELGMDQEEAMLCPAGEWDMHRHEFVEMIMKYTSFERAAVARKSSQTGGAAAQSGEVDGNDDDDNDDDDDDDDDGDDDGEDGGLGEDDTDDDAEDGASGEDDT